MRLLDDLEGLLAAEHSPFRAQLLREDLARLRKLHELAGSAPDPAAFLKAGMLIGWTQGNARTQELRDPLEQLLAAVYAFERGQRDADQEARIVQSWHELHRLRMERLLGCLSTPLPRPID